MTTPVEHDDRPRRRRHPAAYVAGGLCALLVAEIAVVVVRDAHHSGGQAAPPETTLAPTTVPTTAVPPTTGPSVATTTSPAAGGTPLCTPADLSLSTSTGQSSYVQGSSVSATTSVTDVVACDFQPEPDAAYGCAATVVFEGAGGQEVWPTSGQAEQCSVPPARVLVPGSSESLTITWPLAEPTGSYTAVGTWAWFEGGATSVAHVDSGPFAVT